MTNAIHCARVSTAVQSLDHQRTRAEAAGLEIDEVVAGHARSGVTTTLAEWPESRRLFDRLRQGDVLDVLWAATFRTRPTPSAASSGRASSSTPERGA